MEKKKVKLIYVAIYEASLLGKIRPVMTPIYKYNVYSMCVKTARFTERRDLLDEGTAESVL